MTHVVIYHSCCADVWATVLNAAGLTVPCGEQKQLCVDFRSLSESLWK